MTLQQILAEVRTFDGILELAPQAGSDYPEIAWGDHFFYYAPDGQVPRRQPYATIVTKTTRMTRLPAWTVPTGGA